MPRPNRVVQLDLEELALAGRERAWTREKIVKEMNGVLADRRRAGEDVGARINVKSLDRYYASLDEASVPVLHRPQVAERNAMLAIDFAEQFTELNQTVRRWMTEADEAQRYVYVDGEAVEAGPDWDARVRVAQALQRNLDSYADLLERIHNAQQTKEFQEEVMTAIAEADPETARQIAGSIEKRHSLRLAALTGRTDIR